MSRLARSHVFSLIVESALGTERLQRQLAALQANQDRIDARIDALDAKVDALERRVEALEAP